MENSLQEATGELRELTPKCDLTKKGALTHSLQNRETPQMEINHQNLLCETEIDLKILLVLS